MGILTQYIQSKVLGGYLSIENVLGDITQYEMYYGDYDSIHFYQSITGDIAQYIFIKVLWGL